MALQIFVENQAHEIESNEVTAAQIRSLGNIPADNRVFRETLSDEPDPEVPTGPFKVHEGEKFYAVPPGNFGAVTTVAEAEINDLIDEFGGSACTTADGQRWLVLDRFVLGPRWNPPVAQLAVRITGYPEAALDGFCIPGHVRLLSGAQPQATSPTAVFGSDVWWSFSYHPVGRVHSLRGYIGFVRQRLDQGN